MISWDEWPQSEATLGGKPAQDPLQDSHHCAGSIAGSWPLCKVLPADSALHTAVAAKDLQSG